MKKLLEALGATDEASALTNLEELQSKAASADRMGKQLVTATGENNPDVAMAAINGWKTSAEQGKNDAKELQKLRDERTVHQYNVEVQELLTKNEAKLNPERRTYIQQLQDSAKLTNSSPVGLITAYLNHCSVIVQNDAITSPNTKTQEELSVKPDEAATVVELNRVQKEEARALGISEENYKKNFLGGGKPIPSNRTIHLDFKTGVTPS